MFDLWEHIVDQSSEYLSYGCVMEIQEGAQLLIGPTYNLF